ncbi:hypothetical protein [Novosphingobium sp.]|uniref:hypothetical protein n=1 Tax=Novosphingobium sp. TaxID=1874826 RepID=UPI003B5164F7
MGWLKEAITGPDNQTVAIGRLIGMAIAVVLILVLPVMAVITTALDLVNVEIWTSLFFMLQTYIPLIVASVGFLVWGTNGTEPKQTREEPDNGR